MSLMLLMDETHACQFAHSSFVVCRDYMVPQRRRKGYDMVRTRLARINAFLQEHFAGAQTVQIFNAEAKSFRTFEHINDEYRRANIDTIFYYACSFHSVDLIGAVGIALIIWYGGIASCRTRLNIRC